LTKVKCLNECFAIATQTTCTLDSRSIALGPDRLSELCIGQTESLSRTITAEDVSAFARLSGDYNALHLDDEFAARTEFAQRVVHGFLSASLLSALIGMKIPGRGALYVSQNIEFAKPVFIGDTVEARGTIEAIDEETRLVTLRTAILRGEHDCVLRGCAQVKVLRTPEPKKPGVGSVPAQMALLSGQSALVTGASRGIGRAIARLFAQHGAKVWINYHRSQTAAESLAEEIAKSGGACRIIRADVTSSRDVAWLMDAIAADGELNIVVNNAGPKIQSAPFAKFTWPDLAQAYEQIVGSAFHVTKAALPALKKSRGRIVTIVSSAAHGRTTYNWLPYVAAKSALLAMSKNLAQELGPYGIAVNTISPSLVDTDLVANMPDRMRQMIVSHTPLRRLATPEDVAGAALMVASPYTGFISGEDILVTGGEYMA
jgi:3-oxoacyl-[acyl-carrier protein] reductase